MHIPGGSVNHGFIDGLSHFRASCRRLPVRNHIPVMIKGRLKYNIFQIFLVIFLPFFRYIPHLQIHYSKTSHRIPGNFDGHIFPVAEPFHLIDVFVRQVHTPCKGHLPVNHHNFPVIPVILGGG